MQDQIKDEWIEAGARAIAAADMEDYMEDCVRYDARSRAALAAVAPLIRALPEAEVEVAQATINRLRAELVEVTFQREDYKQAFTDADILLSRIVDERNDLRSDLAQAQAQNEALRKALASQNQVCIACGKPWDGEQCGQQDNGWPHAVCMPVPALKEPFHDH